MNTENLCSCGNSQSYPIPHEHDRTDRENAIIKYFGNKCKICGELVTSPSMAGPDICPWCDMGKCRYCSVRMTAFREEIDGGRSLKEWRKHIAWHKKHIHEIKALENILIITSGVYGRILSARNNFKEFLKKADEKDFDVWLERLEEITEYCYSGLKGVEHGKKSRKSI